MQGREALFIMPMQFSADIKVEGDNHNCTWLGACVGKLLTMWGRDSAIA